MVKLANYMIRLLLVTAVISSLVISCKKEESTNYTNYVSKEYVITYSTDYINNLLNTAAQTYPAVNDLKSLMTRSVDVYKLVYKTEVEGSEINASGLICVPAEEGEYPILSFQNGTNTMNSFAPSEFFLNPPYQFVEIIASLGYAVIIPDYPGFGESSDIDHTYLIKGPTVRSIVDMMKAAREIGFEKSPGLKIKNDVFIMGYSQGGWATLAIHKALEIDYAGDFVLKGSVCGAGPYNLNLLVGETIDQDIYPNPVYLAYILNAYSAYDQFTNPVTEIMQEPYASRLPGLFNGSLSMDDINNQLTTSIPDLLTSDFISGFSDDPGFASVRDALSENSIEPWKTMVPLLLIHGGSDTSVNPVTTEDIYNGLTGAGTSPQTCTKVILPGLDHGDAIFPAMISGIFFLLDLR